jgi:hypothetical protein
VAVGPRPLAHPTAHRRPSMIRALLLAVLLVAGLIAKVAIALDVDLEPYQQARRSGALGSVAGRVIAEPTRPDLPGRPFVGATITLLPRSPILMERLENLKRSARDSVQSFRDAAPAIRKAREAYERELLVAGAPDLTPLLQVDADGTFRVDDLPAGAWLIFGWYSVPRDVATSRINPKERQHFPTLTRLRGFQEVTVWLRDVDVVGGNTATVELNDRNLWFRGVVEERVLDAVGR